jgi:hypothetical protein
MRLTSCFLLLLTLLCGTYTFAMLPQPATPDKYQESLSSASSPSENDISSKPPRAPICIIAQKRHAAARCEEALCLQSGGRCLFHGVGGTRCIQHIRFWGRSLDFEIHPVRWMHWDQTKTACEGCTCSKVERR